MEHLLQGANAPFVRIFQIYSIIQRHQKALSWSKGLKKMSKSLLHKRTVMKIKYIFTGYGYEKFNDNVKGTI